MADIALEQVEDVEFPDDTHATSTGISNAKLAMWTYLASDCLLFGGLISTYLLYKNRPGEIPGLSGTPLRASELFNIPFTSMTSFILLMSSLTMVLAVNSIMRGDVPRMRLWLVSTAVLGGLFLGGQVYEFTEFVREGLGYTSNVSASAFYTLTGFHGAHVRGGRPDAAVRGGLLVPAPAQRGGRGGPGPVLALRRHRLGRDLRDRLPDPLRSLR